MKRILSALTVLGMIITMFCSMLGTVAWAEDIGGTGGTTTTYDVTMEIPIYSMDPAYYMIFHLPTGWVYFDSKNEEAPTIYWSLIVDGKEWKLSSVKATERYGSTTYSEHRVNFGLVGHDYVPSYDTTIPMSTLENGYKTFKLVATVTVPGDELEYWRFDIENWGGNVSYEPGNTSYWVQFYYADDDHYVEGSRSFIRDWNPQISVHGEPEEPHVHSYTYKYVSEVCWMECECGDTCDVREHEFNINGKCERCGYVKQPSEPETPPCSHPDFEYQSVTGAHYKVCTSCGDISEVETHTFLDGKCTVCGRAAERCYDVNGDGRVTSVDAVLILRRLAHLE